MTFSDTLVEILQEQATPLTPQDMREIIKLRYTHWYGTESHHRNVDNGNYKDLNHALLAQIYSTVGNNSKFDCDRSCKPMSVSISLENTEDIAAPELSLTDIDDVETNRGTVYLLRTGTFTKQGKEIIKVGVTTKPLEQRIKQLYTTGVPFEFRVEKSFEIDYFRELERALHKLLVPFQLNQNREFFTEDALPYINEIVDIHQRILEHNSH